MKRTNDPKRIIFNTRAVDPNFFDLTVRGQFGSTVKAFGIISSSTITMDSISETQSISYRRERGIWRNNKIVENTILGSANFGKLSFNRNLGRITFEIESYMK